MEHCRYQSIISATIYVFNSVLQDWCDRECIQASFSKKKERGDLLFPQIISHGLKGQFFIFSHFFPSDSVKIF